MEIGWQAAKKTHGIPLGHCDFLHPSLGDSLRCWGKCQHGGWGAGEWDSVCPESQTSEWAFGKTRSVCQIFKI